MVTSSARDAAILDSHHLHNDNCAILQRDVHFGPDSSVLLSKCGMLELDVLQQYFSLDARGALARHAALFSVSDEDFGAMTNKEVMVL